MSAYPCYLPEKDFQPNRPMTKKKYREKMETFVTNDGQAKLAKIQLMEKISKHFQGCFFFHTRQWFLQWGNGLNPVGVREGFPDTSALVVLRLFFYTP